jgi:Caspase domain
VTENLEKRENKLNIIILDACRAGDDDDKSKTKACNGMKPLASQRTVISSNNQKKFMQQCAIIFACASRNCSYDGVSSECNSLFTGVLLEGLRKNKEQPRLSLNSIIRWVTSKLYTEKSIQKPWMHSTMFEQFKFNDGSYKKTLSYVSH